MHLLKAKSPIKVTDFGIIIFLNEHSLKAPYSIEVRVEGRITSVNDVQPSNEYWPISVTEGGIVICVNDEHPLKQQLHYVVKEEGIIICFID